MRSHHKFGCLMCGKRRRNEDIVNKTYDIYVKDQSSGSLIRIGLCPECFDKYDELCLDEMKTKLEASECCACAESGKSEEMAEVFKSARFVGRMAYGDYWNEVAKVKPKLAQEYTEIIQDERD